VPERRPVGFVFQDYLLFPHLSVQENVAFGLRSRGAEGAVGTARRWLARVELTELASAKPSSLSGGQAQRVALARALATEPRLLLLDEPLAALDATSKASLRRELKRHLAEFGGIAIVVTHDPVDAAVLADDVVVLEGGRVRQRGTMPAIAARPRSRYVADLVGVNLWRGRAAAGSVVVDGMEVSVAAEAAGDVFLVVHPRAVSLFSAEPHGSPRNVWRGRAASIESSAGGVRVSIDGPLPIVAEITPRALAELGLAGGEDVWVSFKASEVEVYDA
jgi:molybdate transport system ATP-binding protein